MLQAAQRLGVPIVPEKLMENFKKLMNMQIEARANILKAEYRMNTRFEDPMAGCWGTAQLGGC